MVFQWSKEHTSLSVKITPSGVFSVTTKPLFPPKKEKENTNKIARIADDGCVVAVNLCVKKRVRENSPGYGKLPVRTQKLGSKQRAKIRESVTATELQYARENCLFITLTLPGSTKQSIAIAAQYSSLLREQFFRELKNEKKRFNGDENIGAVTWVWEKQKRGALHLHVVLGSDEPAWLSHLEVDNGAVVRRNWINRLKPYKRLWNRSKEARKRSNGGIVSWLPTETVRIEVARIKKSVAAYMAKYLSKAESKGFDGGIGPARTWGRNRLACIAEKTHTFLFSLKDVPSEMVNRYRLAWLRDLRDCFYRYGAGVEGKKTRILNWKQWGVCSIVGLFDTTKKGFSEWKASLVAYREQRTLETYSAVTHWERWGNLSAISQKILFQRWYLETLETVWKRGIDTHGKISPGRAQSQGTDLEPLQLPLWEVL